MYRLDSLLVIALAAHYCTYVVTESVLFARVRSLLAKYIPKLGEMASCYNCMAFWCGLFMLALWFWVPYGKIFVVVCAIATAVQLLMHLRWKTEP